MARIKPGMTKAEVIAVVGTPLRTGKTGDAERLNYTLKTARPPFKVSLVDDYYVDLQAGKVTGFGKDVDRKFKERARVLTLDSTSRPPSARVEILDGDPARPFTVIAELTCYGSERDATELTQALHSKAMELGAQAIIRMPPIVGYSGGGSMYGMSFGTRVNLHVKAIVFGE